MKKYDGNFQVVSTDYDTYAIIYICTPQTALYDKEVITILSRISPSLGLLPQDFEDNVKNEFQRIFGKEQKDKFLQQTEAEQLQETEPQQQKPEDELSQAIDNPEMIIPMDEKSGKK